MTKLTHLADNGEARMVDVSEKEITDRTAVAQGSILMEPSTLKLIADGLVKKGDVISVARIAGIMAAKRTSDLIPLCHPLALNQVDVKITCDEKHNSVDIVATCRVGGRTGVEMEALHAVSVAALTVYDMCKAVDRGMKITDIRLMHKSGGKSGEYRADAAP